MDFTRGQKIWAPEVGWAKYERALKMELDASYVAKADTLHKVRTSTLALFPQANTIPPVLQGLSLNSPLVEYSNTSALKCGRGCVNWDDGLGGGERPVVSYPRRMWSKNGKTCPKCMVRNPAFVETRWTKPEQFCYRY